MQTALETHSTRYRGLIHVNIESDSTDDSAQEYTSPLLHRIINIIKRRICACFFYRPFLMSSEALMIMLQLVVCEYGLAWQLAGEKRVDSTNAED